MKSSQSTGAYRVLPNLHGSYSVNEERYLDIKTLWTFLSSWTKSVEISDPLELDPGEEKRTEGGKKGGREKGRRGREERRRERRERRERKEERDCQHRRHPNDII